jgi:hypothetical protein
MTNDEIKIMIDNYFDGELDKSKEPVLFSALSSEIEAREYFKKLHALKTAVTETIDSFPPNLEVSILKSINKKIHKNISFGSRIPRIISIASTVVLLIICSLLFLDLKDYKSKLASVNDQVQEQKETIEIMQHNIYPAVVVSPEDKNEIIVRANTRRKI